MPFELVAPWDRILPAVLVGLGALLAVGSLLLARVTRFRAQDTPSSDDPLGDFRPRSIEEVEAERPRWWPAVGTLLGLVLVASGLAVSPVSPAAERAAPSASPSDGPYLVDVRIAAAETPTPSPTPTPTPTPTPRITAAPRASSSGSGGSGSGGSAGSSGGAASAPAPAPTPTPRPGPFVEAGASCFGDTASLSYQVTARGGTVLSTLQVLLDGRVVHDPGVNGSAQHNGQYQQVRTPPGSHTFAIATTASDGGRTHRTYPFSC